VVPFIGGAFTKNNNSKKTYINNQPRMPCYTIAIGFLNERRLARLITISPLSIHQSHQLKTCTKLPTPRDKLSIEHVTLPPKKKSKTTFGSSLNDSKEDEERTCLDEIGGRGGQEFDATTTQGSIE